MMRRVKIISFFMAMVLILGQMPVISVMAQEGDEKYYIRSVEDFQEFVKNCNYDDWSRGKEFVLTTNLDLTDVEFQPIQVFSGKFDGYNHSIYGLDYTGNGYGEGLFRYITADGVVCNLHVSGTMEAGGKGKCVGGICGINAGRIANSSFRGIVNGKSEVGGIVGENESTGNISYCNSYGMVTGYDGAGGIVGRNYGTVSGCCSKSGVNCDDSWLVEADEGGLEWILENHDTVTLPNGTDIGGIAGFSRGLVIGCTNYGIVGYEHNGYNIGGIAGRQSGQVLRCNNKGKVYGRKDVGGIVGQMEPYIRVEEMDLVSDSMQVLHDQINKLFDDLGVVNADVGTDFDELRKHADAALGYSKDISNQTISFVDGNIATLNDLTGRIEYVVEELPDVLKHVTAAFEKIGGTSDHLQNVNQDLDVIGKIKENEEDYQKYQEIKSNLNENQKRAEEISSSVSGNIDTIKIICRDENGQWIGLEDLRNNSEKRKILLEELESAAGNISELARVITSMPGDLMAMENLLAPYFVEGLGDAGSDFSKAMKELQSFSTMLQIASTQAEDIADYLEDQSNLTFHELGGEYHDNVKHFMDELGYIKDSAANVAEHFQNDSDVVLEDLKKINDQFNIITQLVTEKISNAEDLYRDKDIYEDISDEDIEANADGKVSECKNTGYVAGNVNVGGIAGAMAIDEEDPEDNAAGTAELIFGGRYRTKCIIYKCENQGQIVAKKGGVGGIAGFMKLGIITHCEGYGRIESREGEYVGGICGQSLALIRDCFALVTLNGTSYVGGVAGYGNEIHNCYAMLSANRDAKWKGAVAGFVETKDDSRVGYGDNITGNYYVSESLGGIDQISLKGAVQEITYEELLSMETTPQAFRNLFIYFVVDEQIVASLPVKYGEKVSEITLPAVPQKDGAYGKWESIPYDKIEANIIVNAEYFDQITTLKSDGKEKADALIDGNFSDSAVLNVSKSEEIVTENGSGKNAVIYNLTMENAGFTGEDVSKVRILNPYERILDVQVLQGENWESIPYKEYGRYLQIEMQGNQICVRVLERGPLNFWFLIAASTVAFVVVSLLIIAATGRKRRKK